MVFEIEAQFQQLIHCKFRENVVRLLYIPTIKDGNLFLIVNKYGKVGLYEPEKFTLIYTYILDLSVPMQPEMSKKLTLLANSRSQRQVPKCERTHLVVDAIYATDVKSVVFATTKNILQWYDIGEIETQNLGLDAFPRKEYMNLKFGESPVPLRNKGHAETHRIFGLPEIPYCMEYSLSDVTKVSTSKSNVEVVGKSVSKLIIGDLDGCITIISIKDPRNPFGKRKIRGKLHKIKIQDLFHSGLVKIYKAHNDLVKELRFITPRQLIISCSRDKKFSLFVHDITEAIDPFIISLPKGVNSFAHSESLKIIATGSDDCIIRLFNQFVMKLPQMELYGHKCGIMSVDFTNVAFSTNQILISFSKDVELRAWDPVTYVCLQSLYVSFPIKSTIMCKTPEFAKKSLIVHQPHYSKLDGIKDCTNAKEWDNKANEAQSMFQKGRDGFILLIYCNSYARLCIEKEKANWPFDFHDFVSEFEEMTTVYEKKMRKKKETESKDPRQLKLSDDEIADIECKLDNYVQEITDIRRRVNRKMGVSIHDPQKTIVPPKLKRQITSKHVEENKLSRSLLKDHNAVFKALPLYDLQPVELSTKNLRIPDVMKEEMGVDKISSLNDLLSAKAQRYFSSPSNMKLFDEIKSEKIEPVQTQAPVSSTSSLVSSTPDELAYKVHPAELPFKTKASQNNLSDLREDDLSSISSVVSDDNDDNDDIIADDDDSDILGDFESFDFQKRLQKMVQSYQTTLEEQLQVPCSVNTNDIPRKKRSDSTFSENGVSETERSNNMK